jgi:hypothetical protein
MTNAAGRQPVRLRSTWARALAPVLGGLAFLVVLALVTWGIAAWIARGGADVTDQFAPTRFQVSTVETAAEIVEREGPIIFPGLNTTTGERTLVLDHRGDDPTRGWSVYYAHPVDRPDCPVEQVVGTREFTDCDGATLDVTDLSPPAPGVNPIVENQRVLYIDLSGVTPG